MSQARAKEPGRINGYVRRLSVSERKPSNLRVSSRGQAAPERRCQHEKRQSQETTRRSAPGATRYPDQDRGTRNQSPRGEKGGNKCRNTGGNTGGNDSSSFRNHRAADA